MFVRGEFAGMRGCSEYETTILSMANARHLDACSASSAACASSVAVPTSPVGDCGKENARPPRARAAQHCTRTPTAMLSPDGAQCLTMDDSPCKSAFVTSPVTVRRLTFTGGKEDEDRDLTRSHDAVERGESTHVLGKPLRPVSGRWKRCVVQATGSAFYLLEEATEALLLVAKRVGDHFYLSQSPSFVDATEKDVAACMMKSRGATMSPGCNGVLRCRPDQKQFVLYSTACELCDSTLGKFSCGVHSQGKLERQRLAVIRHKMGQLAPGVTARILISDLPPVNPDNRRVVWCPRASEMRECVKVQVPFGSPSVRFTCGSVLDLELTFGGVLTGRVREAGYSNVAPVRLSVQRRRSIGTPVPHSQQEASVERWLVHPP